MVTGSDALVGVYLSEELALFKESFERWLSPNHRFTLVGSSGRFRHRDLESVAGPVDAVVVGTREMDDELTRELAALRQVWPGVGIVVLTDATVPGRPAVIERFNAALQRGYALLPKERLRSVDDLVHTLLNTCEGRVVVDAAVTETLMRARPSEQLIMDRFSARETEVLHLMSAGYCNKAIAMDLCISCKTVERHIQSIYSKVGDPPDEIQPRAHAVAVHYGAMAA